MLLEPDMAEDQWSLSKASDGTPELLSIFSNFNNYGDEVSDIACLIPHAINIEHWNRVFRGFNSSHRSRAQLLSMKHLVCHGLTSSPSAL